MTSEIACLAFDLHLCSLEAICSTDLVDVLRPLDDNTKSVWVGEGGMLRLDRSSSRKAFDCLDDSICDVFCLDLSRKDLAFKLSIAVLDERCKVVKVPPCT